MSNALKMRPNGRNEGPTVVVVVVVVDDSSKSASFDGGGQSVDGNKQVEDKWIAIEDVREERAYDDVIVEGFGEERRYPTMA